MRNLEEVDYSVFFESFFIEEYESYVKEVESDSGSFVLCDLFPPFCLLLRFIWVSDDEARRVVDKREEHVEVFIVVSRPDIDQSWCFSALNDFVDGHSSYVWTCRKDVFLGHAIVGVIVDPNRWLEMVRQSENEFIDFFPIGAVHLQFVQFLISVERQFLIDD